MTVNHEHDWKVYEPAKRDAVTVRICHDCRFSQSFRNGEWEPGAYITEATADLFKTIDLMKQEVIKMKAGDRDALGQVHLLSIRVESLAKQMRSEGVVLDE